MHPALAKVAGGAPGPWHDAASTRSALLFVAIPLGTILLVPLAVRVFAWTRRSANGAATTFRAWLGGPQAPGRAPPGPGDGQQSDISDDVLQQMFDELDRCRRDPILVAQARRRLRA